MYRQSGMTEAERDRAIYNLYLKRVSYIKIAKRVGISVGAVRASLTRTAERMTGLR
jgi:DNA-directed RNA polymerase specialized sigma24 family protein